MVNYGAVSKQSVWYLCRNKHSAVPKNLTCSLASKTSASCLPADTARCMETLQGLSMIFDTDNKAAGHVMAAKMPNSIQIKFYFLILEDPTESILFPKEILPSLVPHLNDAKVITLSPFGFTACFSHWQGVLVYLLSISQSLDFTLTQAQLL